MGYRTSLILHRPVITQGLAYLLWQIKWQCAQLAALVWLFFCAESELPLAYRSLKAHECGLNGSGGSEAGARSHARKGWPLKLWQGFGRFCADLCPAFLSSGNLPSVETARADGDSEAGSAQTLIVSRARCWDMSEVAAFDHQIFPKPTSHAETVVYLLRMHLLNGAALFVIRDRAQGNRIVATSYLRRLYDSQTGFISNVGVHPDYRRRRLADWMLRSLVLPEAQRHSFNRLVLNVDSDYVGRFYERLGFSYFEGTDFDIVVPPGETPMFMNLATTWQMALPSVQAAPDNRLASVGGA